MMESVFAFPTLLAVCCRMKQYGHLSFQGQYMESSRDLAISWVQSRLPVVGSRRIEGVRLYCLDLREEKVWVGDPLTGFDPEQYVNGRGQIHYVGSMDGSIMMEEGNITESYSAVGRRDRSKYHSDKEIEEYRSVPFTPLAMPDIPTLTLKNL